MKSTFPPARGVGNRFAYRYRRFCIRTGLLTWSDDTENYVFNRWFGLSHCGTFAGICFGVTEALTPIAGSGPLATFAGIISSILLVVGFVSGLGAGASALFVINSLLAAACRKLFPPEPY